MTAEARNQAPAASLWAAFERTAGRHAADPAVRDTERRYTYDELRRLSTAAAATLRALGTVPSEPVLVCTDRTVDAVVALLAVTAAGATPVPVEPDGPRPRLEQIAAACGARFALVDGLGAAGLRDCGAVTAVPLALDQAVRGTAPEPTASAAPAPQHAGDLAYILFTSGSTGTPKGVEVTGANFLAFLAGADSWDTSSPADVWGCWHAFTFDISMWEIWRPLTVGAQLFVFPRAAQIDDALTYSLLEAEQISVLCHTPTAVRLLADRTLRSGLPPALRRLLVAGERLDFGILEPFASALRDGTLEAWNLYGPTEATVYATGHRVSAQDVEHEKRSLIGRALPHVQVAMPEPDAEGVGELWISGAGVAAGYRGDPALTGERFRTDAAGRRSYRTGDLVRAAEDGELEFVARSGGYVKVRGYRVEPGEIAAALCAHPDVVEAAAVVTDALGWGDTVVAGVVPRAGTALSEVELRRHAAALLPQYLRPARIVFLQTLPRLSSAKLDISALTSHIEELLAGTGRAASSSV